MRQGHASILPWIIVTLIPALFAATAHAVPVDSEDAPDSGPDRSALIEQLLDKGDGPQLADHRCIEADLVDPVIDLRHLARMICFDMVA